MWNAIKARLAPFIDPTVLIFLVIGLLLLWLIDPVMAKTLATWALIFPFAMVAVAVIASRVVFHNIVLSAFVEKAAAGDIAAANIVRAIANFMAAIIIALAIWAKA